MVSENMHSLELQQCAQLNCHPLDEGVPWCCLQFQPGPVSHEGERLQVWLYLRGLQQFSSPPHWWLTGTVELFPSICPTRYVTPVIEALPACFTEMGSMSIFAHFKAQCEKRLLLLQITLVKQARTIWVLQITYAHPHLVWHKLAWTSLWN